MKNVFKPLFALTVIVSAISSISGAAAYDRQPFNFRSSNIITDDGFRSPRYLGYRRTARTRTLYRRKATRRRTMTRRYRAERRAAFREAFTD